MRLDRVTIAITHMPEMVAFYNAVFDAGLAQIGQTPFYQGKLVGLELLFCPNTIAGVDARQNRQQFRFLVDDLDVMRRKAETSGGKLLENQTHDTIGISDPDGNTIEFKTTRR